MYDLFDDLNEILPISILIIKHSRIQILIDSSSDLQIEYQQPKYISRREILSGNLSCFFPHPHLETDSYSVYKGGAILTRLSNFQTNYSSEIMRWNGEDDTEQSFLASVSTNLNLYRCEIQRKGVGKLLTKTVYAVPNGKRERERERERERVLKYFPVIFSSAYGFFF